MPNHIRNRITLTGNKEEIQSLIEKFSREDGDFPCFKKICPMPKILDDTEFGSNIIDHVQYSLLKDGKMFHHQLPMFSNPKLIDDPTDTQLKDIEIGLKAFDTTGCIYWRDWTLKNWGTKWNSYDHAKKGDGVFEFDTAWTGVPDVLKLMLKDFPNVEIYYEYADEDIGSNVGCGYLTYFQHPKSSTKGAYELAFKLHPDSEEYYEFIDGEYKCKDEDEE